MKAEFRKLASLPTPRWTAVVIFGFMIIGAVVVFFAGPGSEPGTASGLALGLPLWVASIVIGAWVVGLEYGQKTMRRTLTTDPRRVRLLVAKLAAATLYIIALTVATAAIGAILFNLAASASGSGTGIPIDETLRAGLAALTQNVIYVAVGFFLALITRSMAGGMTLALAFGFIIDSALSAIPSVGEYSLSTAATDIFDAIAGPELAVLNEDPDVLKAIGIVAAWLVGLALLSGGRFLRSDVD